MSDDEDSSDTSGTQPGQPAKRAQRPRTCCDWAHGMHEECGPKLLSSETKRGDDKVDRLV